MVKNPNRTEEQQEYRDNLAEGLKQLRNQWDTWKELAKTLLEDWKSTIEYLDSISENTDQWEEIIDNLAKNWESETNKKKTEKEKEYKKILLKSDYLLPDWIALQVFYYIAASLGAVESDKKWIPNVNWTDFTPFFLNSLKQKYWSQRINILLYGSTPKVAEKVKENLSLKWYNVIYSQDWFSEFDRDKAETSLDEYQDTMNILLVARSTPKIPLQELWTSRNYQKIQEDKLLVMNVWWLFDFMAWVQKRAPILFRKLKIERLWRLCSQPKRNYQKVLNSLMILPYIFHYLILKKD